MAEYVSVQPQQLVDVGQNVLFVDSIPCPNGYVLHRNGSGILTLRGCGSNCFARYEVTFTGNLEVPDGGTAGAIAVALAIDGEALQTSRAIVTPSETEQYFSATSTAKITVPRGCCYTVAVENVSAGVAGPIEQQAISVADGNLTVSRIA